MLEQSVQSKIIKQYEDLGYYVINLIKTNRPGIPDLLLIKDGIASFIEVKRHNGIVSDTQVMMAQVLVNNGCDVQFIEEDGRTVTNIPMLQETNLF